MEAALNLQNQRVAGKNELYSIVRCDFQLDGTTNLTPRARRYLFFLIALVRSGYHHIIAPMAVIADAIYRAQGQTASVRTLRSAFAELEAHGYLTRRRYRIGRRRTCAVIDIHVERFVYWTKVKNGNVVPYTTSSYNSSYRQNVPSDDRRNTNIEVNSLNSSVISEKKPRASARSKKSAKIHHYHPIVYTLICAVPNNAVKPKILDLANRELNGERLGTGIDWGYYTRLWPSLDHGPGGRREITARTEILPLLYSALKTKGGATRSGVPMSPPMAPASSSSSTTSVPASSSSSTTSVPASSSSSTASLDSSKVREIIGNFLKEKPKQKPVVLTGDLSDEERLILESAKQAIKNRRKGII